MQSDLIEKFKNSANKLILLDYDGTLVAHTPIPAEAIPSKHLLNLLFQLNNKTSTKTVIITGRGFLDIDRLIGFIPIDIIAEHGAMIKENKEWKEYINRDGLWKKKIYPLLNKITLECQGTSIEEKSFSLAWHYRKAEDQIGYTYSRELMRILENRIDSYNLRILDANKVIEIMAKEIGKGKATQYLLDQNNYDYVLSIGDDKTDEDMFEVLLNSEKATTIKVGSGNTSAKYRLNSVEEVIQFLEKLTLCD